MFSQSQNFRAQNTGNGERIILKAGMTIYNKLKRKNKF
jgi:hypothetical protein